MDAQPRHSRREIITWAGIALIAAGVIWFYAFVSGVLFEHPSFSKDNANYYPLLVDGFRTGRLGFQVDPPPQLAKLADPYDPAQRQQAGLADMHDVSYYRGRYYLYFGVAPALTLFWPFRAVTGVHFPQEIATILFCAGGYLCSVALFLGIRRRYFPDTSPGWLWLGTLMLGLGNFCPAMVARNSVWEVPISSAYFYSCLGLLWLLKAAEPGRRRQLWLMLVGLAFGLSVASRPHFVFLCAMLGVFWLWDLGRRLRFEKSTTPLGLAAGETAALFLPIAAIVAGLLVYNYERFDDPFEFGMHFNLGGINQRYHAPLALRYVFVNFYYYFLAPAQYQRYFPFVTVIRGFFGARPAEYTGIEDPYGILPNLPCCWLAFAAPLIWWWRGRRLPGLGRWLALFSLCFIGIGGASLCVDAAINRYMVDFLPTLLLVASVALLLLARRGALGRGAWWLLKAGTAAVVLYSAAFSMLAGINHNGIFATNEPAAYETLARFFNRPVLAWEAIHPDRYGPAEITLRFPTDRPGAAEPILVTGVSYLSDYLYAIYTADGRHVQLGFSHTNHNQRLSQEIPIDFRVPHTIGVQLGSLYPPLSHPFFAGWTPAAIRAAKRTLTVTFDGVPYLSGEQDFFDSSPGFVKFGINDVSAFVAPKFSGQILKVDRQPLPPAVKAFAGNGFLRLALFLPKAKPGTREPLVSTGIRGRDDRLFIEYQDDNRVRFGFAHGSQPPEFSPTSGLEGGPVQLLEVSFGSFYDHPRNARERELAKVLYVRLNGQSLWVKNEPFYPTGPRSPSVATDIPGGPGGASAFTGEIVAKDTVQLLPVGPDSSFAFAPYWIETGAQPNYGPIRMRIALAPQVQTPIESLVVTGPASGQADYISIAYPSPKQITFGYLQTGMAALKSRRILVDHQTPLTVEIDMPSLYPSDTDEFFSTCSLDEILSLKSGWVHLKANGQMLINAPAPHFESTADQITIGENRISNVYEYAPGFTARILSIERARYAAPSGFDQADGPLEMILTLKAIPGASEALLATGPSGSPDALLVACTASGQCRFSVKTADGPALTSQPVAVDLGSRHTLIVQWGGFYASGDRRRRVSVRLDDKPVLSGNVDFHFSVPQAVAIGSAFPSSPAFSGLVHSVRRLPSSAQLP